MAYLGEDVFSNTIDDPDEIGWENARLAGKSPEEEIEALKNEPGSGGIAVAGGVTLVRSLTHQALIDDYRLAVHPVALGEGLSIFPGHVSLDLVDSQRPQRGPVEHIPEIRLGRPVGSSPTTWW